MDPIKVTINPETELEINIVNRENSLDDDLYSDKEILKLINYYSNLELKDSIVDKFKSVINGDYCLKRDHNELLESIKDRKSFDQLDGDRITKLITKELNIVKDLIIKELIELKSIYYSLPIEKELI